MVDLGCFSQNLKSERNNTASIVLSLLTDYQNVKGRQVPIKEARVPDV